MLVTVTPGLLAVAEQLVDDRVVLVHQEHRSSSDRVSGLEPLLTFGPRADVVALLTESAPPTGCAASSARLPHAWW